LLGVTLPPTNCRCCYCHYLTLVDGISARCFLRACLLLPFRALCPPGVTASCSRL
jgi:hypothetical protein